MRRRKTDRREQPVLELPPEAATTGVRVPEQARWPTGHQPTKGSDEMEAIHIDPATGDQYPVLVYLDPAMSDDQAAAIQNFVVEIMA